MKKLTQLSAVIISAGLISTANAAMPGAYMGGGLGYGMLKTPNYSKEASSLVQSYSLSQKWGGVSGRVFGGYNFNNYFGLEAGLARYANSKNKLEVPTTVTAREKYSGIAFDVVGKGYLPLADSGVSVYALGGAAYVRQRLSGNVDVVGGETRNLSKTNDGVRPMFGLGVAYTISPKVTTNLEFTRIQGVGNLKQDTTAIATSDLLTLNVAYHFG